METDVVVALVGAGALGAGVLLTMGGQAVGYRVKRKHERFKHAFEVREDCYRRVVVLFSQYDFAVRGIPKEPGAEWDNKVNEANGLLRGVVEVIAELMLYDRPTKVRMAAVAVADAMKAQAADDAKAQDEARRTMHRFVVSASTDLGYFNKKSEVGEPHQGTWLNEY